MDTTDICEMDEFKDDPSCKKSSKNCGLTTDIFWAIVLITVSFFTRIWYMIVDRILTKLFGIKKDDYELAFLGVVSLIVLLTLTQGFDVNIAMD